MTQSMPDPPQSSTPPARFILVYTNDDGTTTSHRHWTWDDAIRRLAVLNATENASGRWTIHETTEVET